MKIGVIGGLGAYAGVHAVQLINDYAVMNHKAQEDKDFPEIVYHQVPFKDVNSLGEGSESHIREQLMGIRDAFTDADRVLFSCNMYNYLADEVFGEKNVSLLPSELPEDAVVFASQENTYTTWARAQHPTSEGRRMTDIAIQYGMRGIRSEAFIEHIQYLAGTPVIACTELSYVVHRRVDRPYIDTLTQAVSHMMEEK